MMHIRLAIFNNEQRVPFDIDGKHIFMCGNNKWQICLLI